MGHLRLLLQTLKEHQLYAKYSKFEFWMRLLTFHGQIIFSEGVKVDPRKTEAVKSMPRPLNLIDIRSFMGLVGYYQMFEDGFASITFPLTTLTQKSRKFEWSEACNKSF